MVQGSPTWPPGAADDLWVVATCNPYRGEEGRGLSLVNHISDATVGEGERIHSRLSTAFSVPILDVRVRAADGGRSVSLAGDWSTIATLRYRPGEPVVGPDGAAASDLWCLDSLDQRF